MSISTSLPVGGVSIVVLLLTLKLPSNREKSDETLFERIKQLDFLGATLLIPAVVCLLLALQWGGNRYPWNNSRIIGLFVGFGVLAILFTISQIWLQERATIPPRILKNRTVASSVLFGLFFGGGFFLLVYYLPIYFQSVRNSSAMTSGIQLLPLMLATVVASVIYGGLITAAGYYTPFLIGATAIVCIGVGLLSTYSIDISNGKWIGYQILTGAGVGAGLQIPMTAVQTVLSQDDIPIGSAAVMFFQTLGGALFIAVGQSVFQNGLISGLQKFTPSLNPFTIVGAGATEIRHILSVLHQEDQLHGVLQSYMQGITNTIRVSLALCLIAFLCSLLLEWKSVKKDGNDGKSTAAIGV
ncbi:Major Facilitator Superfamily [Aspergillus sclerotialis]|uniref:Major Facilitator Superfamily n=1 Tax=Aspergillus sclerotialis TaxID=2070753 RepID=A0A3A2ZXZ5_9EURO|nr:Major Facilitator Superfamily [Aspergillus sclerotialis]